MPQVIYNKTKGLFQKAGNGYNLEGDTEGYGRHILVEEVEVELNNAKVGAQLSRYIPAGAIIVNASMTLVQKGGTNDSIVFLGLHNAASTVGTTAASAVTEYAGEDVGSNAGIPDDDLNIGANGTLGDTIIGRVSTDRDTDASYIVVANADNNAGDAGTPKVSVTIEWVGGPSVAV
jgi:hypothetical protein